MLRSQRAGCLKYACAQESIVSDVYSLIEITRIDYEPRKTRS